MSQSFVPQEVSVEFLRNLWETVNPRDPVILVLRCSLLLSHWYGESARPAADIDLECFERVRGVRSSGVRQRFTSLVDNARGLCCFAAQTSPGYPRRAERIEFDEIDAPEDGESLWEYGSPGERFYLGWVWHGREGQRGRLQLDIAESGSYDFNEISVDDIHLTALDGITFPFPAYTPEMMLAAKLSWLMRGMTRRTDDRGSHLIAWAGEPKDLFDAHLLLTRSTLRADVFQKSLLAVGADDERNWNDLHSLFCGRSDPMAVQEFANWEDFRRRHAELVSCGPAEMVKTVAERLEPLLGDFSFR